MTTWITSDWHADHDKIRSYSSRPFSSVDEMREALIRNFNELVKPTDHTWHLGDFSMREATVPEVLPRLNGEHSLVFGNHDIAHPANKKNKRNLAKIEAAQQRYRDYGFKEVVLETKLVVDGLTLLLHHMPYEADERHGQRYSDWRPKNEGLWLLHGHIHQLWKVKGKQINVGVDRWDYRPVSIDQIVALIASNPEDC